MERTKTATSKSMNKEVLLAPKSERVEMTLNTSSALTSGLLIQRLTELYENPVEAAVRETVSNAIDAVSVTHSGPRPVVSIETPTTLNPVLVVSDNGVGMSYEDLKEIYSKYGASTKADDFNQVGAYGLGAKAPLAYGTEFTVTSVKDGVKTTIIVAREELTNYIKIIDSVHTDEPSGTTVSIPVSNGDIDRFSVYVNNYEKYPMEKDIDFVINDKLKNDSEYVLLNKGIKTFQSGDDSVKGRVWVKKGMEFHILTKYTMEEVMQKTAFLIGGWIYASPNYRRSGQEACLVVELKAGIVGFNSSRDSILDNERSESLMGLVNQYLASQSFPDNLVSLINNYPLTVFKGFLSEIISEDAHALSFKNGEIVKTPKRSTWYNKRKQFNIKFEDLVHKETGFCLKSALADFPENIKFAAYRHTQQTYKKTPDFNIFRNDSSMYYSSAKASVVSNYIKHLLTSENLADFSKFFIEEILLNDFLMASGENSYQNKRASHYFINTLFITGVDTTEKALKLSRMRTKIDEIIPVNPSREFSSSKTKQFVIVNCSKEKIEKLIKTAGLCKNAYSVKTYEEITEEVAKKKAAQPPKEKREVYKRPLIEVNHTDRLKIEDSTKKKVVVCNGRHPDKELMRKFKNWYANTNKIKIDDFDMFFTVGQVTIEDVDYLLRVADDVLRASGSGSLGKSASYHEKIHDNVCKEDMFYELEEDYYSDVDLVIEIVSAIKGCSVLDIATLMVENQKSQEKCVNLLGLDMNDFGFDVKETAFYKVLEKRMSETNRYRHYYSSRLEDIAIKLLNKLPENIQNNINEILTFFSTSKLFVWDEETNEIDIDYCRYNDFRISEYELKEAIAQKANVNKFKSRYSELINKRAIEDLMVNKDIFEIVKNLEG
jgi:hypothetical protein